MPSSIFPGRLATRRPRPSDEPLQGRIIATVLHTVSSTREIIACLREDPQMVRKEVSRLHLIGILQPVGIRDGGPRNARLYDRDYCWDLTIHARHHSNDVSDCYFCMERETLNTPPGYKNR